MIRLPLFGRDPDLEPDELRIYEGGRLRPPNPEVVAELKRLYAERAALDARIAELERRLDEQG